MLTMKFLLPLMLVLAACWASEPIFGNVPPQSIEEVSDNYRLPKGVIPLEYDIKLEPTFESSEEGKNFTFDGKSEITLDITENTRKITFHAKGLRFYEKETTLTYKDKDGKTDVKLEKETITFSKDTRKDFVTLTFNQNIDKIKNAKLYLHYEGKLNEELRGFYRSSYQDKDGKKRWLATTQFEPVSARQAFPCWDEPEFKATFTISIKVPPIKGYKATSNMEVNGKPDDKNSITFNKTPKMSTYLVAFVVSDFEALPNKQGNFRVLAKPTVKDDAKELARNYGWQTLEELKVFTNIDYYDKKGQGMDKLDQIAIPDFAAGAMENWGLVTYREPRLLYIENKTTTEEKQAIVTIMAHELSHQWFGNLVTCEWWSYIWLNEGFATFFQYYISDKIIEKVDKNEESWRLMEQFVIKNVQASSFVVDASSKTRALNVNTLLIQTPTQIRSLFDDIAYKKGASILNMMYGFLSEDIFKEGLRTYLNNYKNKAVNSDNLFESIEKSDKKKLEKYLPDIKDVSLKKVMDNWVNKPGYPVITVSWSKTKEDVVNITQERFFLEKPTKDDTQWYIPVNYVTEDEPEVVKPTNKKSLWMIPGTHTLIDKLKNTKWILFNNNQTGYYRVNYDDSNWKLLAKYLISPNYANISAINRAQLIDDALNLARAGHVAYKTSLDITVYLSNETDYIPWYAAVRAFNYLDSVLLGGKNYTAYHKYVAHKIAAFASEANYTDPENGGHVNKLAKVLALNTACRYGVKNCESFVYETLEKWLEKKDKEDENILVADLRSGILCAALRVADEKTWDKTLKKYKTIEDKDKKADVLAGLGCASKEIAKKFLNLTLEKDPVVDIFAAMNSISTGNAESFDILVEFIHNNIERIQEADKDNSRLISLFNNLSMRVVTAEQYAELSLLVHGQLQVTDKVEGLTVAIQNLAWIKNYREEVEKWIITNCEVCQSDGKPDSASSIALTSLLLIVSLLFTRFY